MCVSDVRCVCVVDVKRTLGNSIYRRRNHICEHRINILRSNIYVLKYISHTYTHTYKFL